MKEQLTLISIQNAINTLQVALHEYEKDESNDIVRDACIQRFEYCYSLATKFIARYLSAVAADPIEIQAMSFPEQIREAYTRGILKNSWDAWSGYRQARNITSHTYNAQKAAEVMAVVPAFYQETAYLVEQLVERNEN